CDRLTALVSGLLLLARADAGEVELTRKPVDLLALAADVAEMGEPPGEERGSRFRWECSSPAPVLSDAPRLRQLVTNLLDHAIKVTAPGGSVTLPSAGPCREARLVVADTGNGIGMEHLPHIFERFYPGDASRSTGETGL